MFKPSILTIPLQAFFQIWNQFTSRNPPEKRSTFHRTSGVKRRPTEPNMASKLDGTTTKKAPDIFSESLGV